MNRLLILCFLSLMGCSTQNETSKVQEIETHSLSFLEKKVISEHEDDIGDIRRKNSIVCTSYEVSGYWNIGGSKFPTYRDLHLVSEDTIFVYFRNRIQDEETVTKEELWKPNAFLKFFGFKEKTVTKKEDLPEKFRTDMFYLPDTYQNRLKIDDLREQKASIISYEYDRGRYKSWDENACQSGEVVVHILTAITIANHDTAATDSMERITFD